MNNLTYEAAISRLEEIVNLLEKNEISLDESIRLFEEGIELTAYCSNTLKNAQQKITTLSKEQL